ncbi:uncharacterized protein L969DRAFT_94850 [Mixia osmundae IAM 14324]|uniref:(2E,6E)-farnesyl diphosphate synthase n=1 Tax=Mixia osmundae (strain CBS 9802 / IAM 14324 / JCM 22182 / KY 12970) TaxID=764103 RepID=G7E1X9_MIXOS|nr:uncharacterized protein L969DRAFT_94850 [Mixia osmundae IAM 14324]KEI38651.1 hypothetical protein L969DRAFT_94850 [Mixia osmundae IAM 14324]GAA96892.1 hypothetical protein E5Q_03565 [Mixia osmundae IAM 14324]
MSQPSAAVLARQRRRLAARRKDLSTSSSRYASRSAWTSAWQAIGLAGADGNRDGQFTAQVREKAAFVDPLKLVGHELGSLRSSIKQLLGSGHPALDTIAKYYFQAEGKHVRPLIVLLMSQAMNGLSPVYEERRQTAISTAHSPGGAQGINEPLSPSDILNDYNPDESESIPSATHGAILPTQRRLAEITEMIHVASLLHDDVIDEANMRRNAPSAPSLFGNKLSILAGDFLLARASVALSRLGSNEAVELVASVLANLVEGEVMQMKGASSGSRMSPELFEHYMQKTYLKTASLIAKSARATAILGGAGTRQGWPEGEYIKDLAYSYGRNLGIAFQLVDDMLDYTAQDSILGKPGQGADLKLGLATAPALLAWEEFPEMGELIKRKFEHDGDIDLAKHLVGKSSGLARTASLAAEYAATAKGALARLPDSEAQRNDVRRSAMHERAHTLHILVSSPAIATSGLAVGHVASQLSDRARLSL